MNPTSRANWGQRLDTLRGLFEGLEIDALAVTAAPNVRYLSGFSGSSGWLVVSRDEARLITDGRYDAAVRQSAVDGQLGPVDVDIADAAYDVTLAAVIADAGLTRVGFEAGHLTVAGLGRWQQASPHVHFIATEAAVEDRRIVKDAVEIAILRRGGRLLAQTAARLVEWVAAGRTERQIAQDIDRAIVAAGFERTAFETIVAAGPNSAHPHARPTDRRLAQGDLVLLDFGGVLEGYCVDLTRMAAIGQVADEALALVDAVERARRTAVATVRAGLFASDIDSAARTELERHGFGPAFRHGTGHGLGLEVHEAPRISRHRLGDVPVTLRTGMVFTIEPGAYVERIGGARLEDDVVVTEDGCDVLTEVTRDLLIV